MTRTRAARLVRHGEPVRIEEVDLVEPAPGEAVVTLAYAGVNPVDRYGAEGLVAADGPVPRTLGTEGSGRIEGRPVLVRGHGLGTSRDGLWAGAAVVPLAAVTDLPQGVDLASAATMGVAGLTAWRVVTELARVGADDRVLVLGANGGVGSIAVAVAHRRGATVWGQTMDPAHTGWLTARGADHVVVAGHGELAEATTDLEPTVVIDPLGGGFTGASIGALAPHGRLVLLGTSAGPTGELPLQALYRKGLTVLGYGGLIEPEEALARALHEALHALANGLFDVPVEAVVPLADVNDAFARLAARGTRGKLVLDVSGA